MHRSNNILCTKVSILLESDLSQVYTVWTLDLVSKSRKMYFTSTTNVTIVFVSTFTKYREGPHGSFHVK